MEILNAKRWTRFLPFEYFTIRTDLTADEVVRRLKDVVEPRPVMRLLFINPVRKPYEGEVGSSWFVINRALNYWMSWLPNIFGKVRSDPAGTLIQVEMMLHEVVLLGWGLSTAALAVSILAWIGYRLFSPAPPDPGLLTALVCILLFWYGFIMVAFKHESKLSRIFLCELLREEAGELKAAVPDGGLPYPGLEVAKCPPGLSSQLPIKPKPWTWFLPFEDFLIRTEMSPAEVLRRLCAGVEPRSYLSFLGFGSLVPRRQKLYEGEVQGHDFSLNRTLNDEWTWLTMVFGKIFSYGKGSLVHVQMRMHWAAFIVWLISLGALIVMAIGFKLSRVFLPTPPDSIILTALLCSPLFWYGMWMAAFKYESYRVRTFLSALFKEQADGPLAKESAST